MRRAEHRRTCQGCGAAYDPEAWAALVLVERIPMAEVRRVLDAWPEHACVEVRACAQCRRPLATRAEIVPSARSA